MRPPAKSQTSNALDSLDDVKEGDQEDWKLHHGDTEDTETHGGASVYLRVLRVSVVKTVCESFLRFLRGVALSRLSGWAIIPTIAMAPKSRFSSQEQARRVKQILRGLDKAYPDARCALHHSNAFELLIATILSAQCTDERVNLVTRELFQKHRTPEDYLKVPRKVLEEEIRSTGFYRNKAKNIQGACQILVEKFGGRVPDTMEELIQLPGVARKTANVVLGVFYGKAEGIVVDTHVFRVAHRLDLSHSDTPEKVERDLMALIPRSRWISFSHQVIQHGRQVCKARRPHCHTCVLEKVCQSSDKVLALPFPRVQKFSERGSRQ